jgi:hypothetical protein
MVSFNQARPHQGLGQRLPDPPVHAAPPRNQLNQVIAAAVLGGFHHHDQRTASLLESAHIKSKGNLSAKLHSSVNLRVHVSFSVGFPSTNKEETPSFFLVAEGSGCRFIERRLGCSHIPWQMPLFVPV